MFSQRVRAQIKEHLDQLSGLSGPEQRLALERLRSEALDEETAEFLAACLEDGFLSGEIGDVAPVLLTDLAQDTESASWRGKRLGPWRIVDHLGSGGMGSVFKVERADGEYAATAALKLLSGTGGSELPQRFQQERQILARLQHPRIARLLDGGSTETGRPYLVMEYVDGERIDSYCDRYDLDLRARLELFLSVCDAVQYAHQNLVVHRDLKPANILVDTAGRVKLLDFGIAKLLDSTDGGDPEITRAQVHPLTPDYAAPEQFGAEPISTATDVYALGVLLYRLLAGATPFDLRRTGLQEMVEKVRKVEPAAPSKRLEGAARRMVIGDLDAVTLKALAKDPEDRYRSVERLAEEIRAYLHGHPVSARSPSAWYRARKFTRRHRTGVIATAAVILALVIGLGAAIWQAHERSLAAQRAETVRDFLVTLFEAASPAQAQGQELTARQVFDQGVLRLGDELDTSPAIKSDLLLTLASIAHQLGDQDRGLDLIDQSIALLQRAGGATRVELADALRLRGSILEQAGEYEAARAELERALELHRASEGESSAVAADLVQLASLDLNAEQPDTAVEALEQALEIVRQEGRVRGPNTDPAVIEGQLAMARRQQGRLDEARDLYEGSLTALSARYGEHHPETVRLRNSLAALLLHQGEYAAAEEHFHRLAEDNLQVYGEDHPLTITARNNLAVVLSKLGRSGEAVPLFRDILAYWHETAGPDHPHAAVTQINLATALADTGEFGEAEALYLDALPRFETIFGRESPHYAVTLLRLADVTRQKGGTEQARAQAEEALAIHRQALPAEHPTTATNLQLLGEIAVAGGDAELARRHFAAALKMRRGLLGDEHPDTIASRDSLARLGGTIAESNDL